MQTADSLQDALKQLGVVADDKQVSMLMTYLSLLNKWNQKHNLTRVLQQDQITWHLLDAASISHMCEGENILDVGSGAGIPGIPLSILLPNKRFVLVDNQQKKCIFLRYVINAISLDNVNCEHISVQHYQSKIKFNTILSRGFAQLTKFIDLCAHLLMPGGKFVAMKADISEHEISNIPTGYQIQSVKQLDVPGLKCRYAFIITKTTD